jgi:acetyl esterase/lipase
MWSVLPPPALPFLALAVIVPEKAASAAAAALAVLLLALAAARGRARRIAVGIAVCALACAALPLVEYPFARAAAERELAAHIGPRLPVPDDASAAARVRVRLALPFRTRDGARAALDVYESSLPGARPTIVTIYGGAWQFGTRAQMADIDRRYAARGYTAIAVDYRHAPRYRFPTQLHDVDDALATIAANAATWHVDRTRVALFGRSAGAELALLAAYAPQPLGIRAAVGYYVPTDLRRGYDEPPVPDPANVRRILAAYIGATPNEAEATYRAASPFSAVRPGLPPTFLVSGDRDSLVGIAFQRAMRDALRAAGDRVTAIEIPWSNHAFDTVPDGLGASIATPAAERFLDDALRPGPTAGA